MKAIVFFSAIIQYWIDNLESKSPEQSVEMVSCKTRSTSGTAEIGIYKICFIKIKRQTSKCRTDKQGGMSSTCDQSNSVLASKQNSEISACISSSGQRRMKNSWLVSLPSNGSWLCEHNLHQMNVKNTLNYQQLASRNDWKPTAVRARILPNIYGVTANIRLFLGMPTFNQ